MMKNNIISFNNIIEKLNKFWLNVGCIILQPTDFEVGAATFHPATFINAVTSDYFRAAYVQLSRRPFDLRYSSFSNKNSIFHQYQVIIKPSINNIKNIYLESLKNIGINIKKNDIKFYEDNWKSPSLGASGIGWEVRLNGIEITQITYFQQMGSLYCNPVMLEIAYGLERLAMHIQNIFNLYDIIFDISENNYIKYSNVLKNYNEEYRKYLILEIDYNILIKDFDYYESKSLYFINKKYPFIAYDFLVKLNNIFNLIDSKNCYGFIRQDYVFRMKNLSEKIAKLIRNDK